MSSAIPRLHEMNEWVDYDVAHFAIGKALGIFEQEYHDTTDIQVILGTRNVISDALIGITSELVKIGFLELDARQLKYRLRGGFDVVALGRRAM